MANVAKNVEEEKVEKVVKKVSKVDPATAEATETETTATAEATETETTAATVETTAATPKKTIMASLQPFRSERGGEFLGSWRHKGAGAKTVSVLVGIPAAIAVGVPGIVLTVAGIAVEGVGHGARVSGETMVDIAAHPWR